MAPETSGEKPAPKGDAESEFVRRASFYTRSFVPKAKMTFKSCEPEPSSETVDLRSSDDEDSASKHEAAQDQQH